ncbi:uncharacterized protein MELLADRAFT_69552 [Melampsora larici-populina 98AG31]|uniref:Uncharacterized protein n=1 Tax=Melampsora larici-populina (strain 98AG31 / pathotype 3-4-7) TaxID=747676 RepID=F4SB54_MELLP|nr:uncharacterized protein MELLADRAFT_69552 [Melampsora larici-populina 98AG31]EGF98136.1 hypothetical protein MELLADRAFT_69552 [Melampsora larici-populina 98AG31]
MAIYLDEEAVETIKNLKALHLSHEYRVAMGDYNPYSFLALTSCLPKLESLVLQCEDQDILEGITDILQPQHLLNISSLSLAPGEEHEVNCHIVQAVNKSLKVVELLHTPHGWVGDDGILNFFESYKDTLQGLFTAEFTKDIMEDVANWNFPNSRVIGF